MRLNSVRVVVATLCAAETGIMVEIVFTAPEFVLLLLLPDDDGVVDGCEAEVLGCCSGVPVPDGCLVGEMGSESVSRCSSVC